MICFSCPLPFSYRIAWQGISSLAYHIIACNKGNVAPSHHYDNLLWDYITYLITGCLVVNPRPMAPCVVSLSFLRLGL
jgi:hypothetical protein